MFITNRYLWVFLLSLFILPGQIQAQTTIQGKLLSVDGSPLPISNISINQVNQRDMFSGYDDVAPDHNGSYSIQLNEPGFYRITFRGVYHHTITVPIVIIDQDVMEMDVALFPFYFNDGTYFGEEGYLEWIRVVGNFNRYDFNTGYPFSLNSDGSISAFIPVDRDTIRYQVRGLTYGGGPVSIPLPFADEYASREDRSFEAVVYNDLPEDSLEIRYHPETTIPYEGMRFLHRDNGDLAVASIRAFVHFSRYEDKYWTVPVSELQVFNKTFLATDFPLINGVPVEKQFEHQFEHSFNFNITDRDVENLYQYHEKVMSWDVHPQQRVLFLLAYASIASHIERRKILIKHGTDGVIGVNPDFNPADYTEELELIESIDIDKEVISKIPEYVSPVHPVWVAQAYTLPRFLSEMIESVPGLTDYMRDIIQHHENESVVRNFVTAYLQAHAHNYEDLEEMDLYGIIVERFGHGDVLRQAVQVFNGTRQN